jgi:hypothetical protein
MASVFDMMLGTNPLRHLMWVPTIQIRRNRAGQPLARNTLTTMSEFGSKLLYGPRWRFLRMRTE